MFLLGLAIGSHGLDGSNFTQELYNNHTYWVFKTSYMWSQYTLCYRYKRYKEPSDSPLVLKQIYEIYDNLTSPKRLKEYSLWSVQENTSASDNFLFTRMRDRMNVTYNLTYWNETEKCFILTFNMSDKTECELDVWDKLPYNDSGLSNCLAMLNSTCKTTLHYYDTNCDKTSAKKGVRVKSKS
uniref:Lipocalin n=1 Tax=Rhipicephalus zambeziensis TaxID=60191 RepID=A0A224YLU5_9ACAR